MQEAFFSEVIFFAYEPDLATCPCSRSVSIFFFFHFQTQLRCSGGLSAVSLEERRYPSLKALQVTSDLKAGAMKKRSCALLEGPRWGFGRQRAAHFSPSLVLPVLQALDTPCKMKDFVYVNAKTPLSSKIS